MRARGIAVVGVLALGLTGCASLRRDALAGGDPLVVPTPAGAVRGVDTGEVREYRSIPYAAPPVGANRWRAPQPVTSWTGLRDATAPPPVCPQVLPVVNSSQGTENCLYLNVVTPRAVPRRLQPVMVWIHGGGFTVGSSNDNDPTKIVARSGVVAVTINYRLGPFGFLALDSLARDDPAHSIGNMGFEDQVAALRWVRASIGRFGGDPDNVTIFGESGGGVSVCDHVLSPRSRGLFHRAIIESGPCGSAGLDPTAQLAQGTELTAKLGCTQDADPLACLRTRSTDAVMQALPPDPTFLFRKAAFWLPVADGVDLPRDGARALATGRFNRVPIIAGVNRDEGRLFIGMAAYTLGSIVPKVTAANYAIRVESYFGPRVGAQVVRRYPLGRYPDPGAAFGQAVGDAILACPAIAGPTKMSRYVPVHLYEYRHAPNPFTLPMTGIDLGAFHAAELPYVFGAPTASSGALHFTEAESRLSNTIIDAWTRFARTGDPSGKGLHWPRVDSSRSPYLVLDTPTRLGSGIKHDECGFWASSRWDASRAGRE